MLVKGLPYSKELYSFVWSSLCRHHSPLHPANGWRDHAEVPSLLPMDCLDSEIFFLIWFLSEYFFNPGSWCLRMFEIAAVSSSAMMAYIFTPFCITFPTISTTISGSIDYCHLGNVMKYCTFMTWLRWRFEGLFTWGIRFKRVNKMPYLPDYNAINCLIYRNNGSLNIVQW